MELKNQSKQKNAIRCPYAVPFQNSVLLDSPAVFLLQSQRFKWIENDGSNIERLEKLCSTPVVFLSHKTEVKDNLIVTHSPGKITKSPRSQDDNSTPVSTPIPSSTPPKKRRPSLNTSLELRKAAHRRSFRSSFQHSRQSTSLPLPTLEEDDQEMVDTQGGRNTRSNDLISFSPAVNTPAENSTPLIDFNSTIGSPTPRDSLTRDDNCEKPKASPVKKTATRGSASRQSARVAEQTQKLNSSSQTSSAEETEETDTVRIFVLFFNMHDARKCEFNSPL